MDANSKMKVVYTIVETKQGKSFWMKVGIGFINHDGSMNLKLDALPVNGTLQVRDYEPRDDRRSDSGELVGSNGQRAAEAQA
jgi:hypothetical protein